MIKIDRMTARSLSVAEQQATNYASASLLVSMKAELDAKLADALLAPHNGLRVVPRRAWINTRWFAEKVIPFLGQCAFSSVQEAIRVPVEQILEDNPRWKAGRLGLNLFDDNQDAIVGATEASMDEFLLHGSETADLARYVLLEQADIYISLDGTSRADAYKDQGEASVPALVATYEYPRADRLSIHATDSGRVVAILDGRWLFPLIMPVTALRLFAGIGVHLTPWPPRIPVVIATIEQWLDLQQRMDFAPQAPIDMFPITSGHRCAPVVLEAA